MSGWANEEIQKTSFGDQNYQKMKRVDVLCKHFGIDLAITEGYERFHLCSDMRKIGLALTAMCIEHDGVITTGNDLAMVQAGHGSIAMTKRYLGHRVDGGSELPKYCHVTELNMSSLEVIKAHVVEDIAQTERIEDIEPTTAPVNVSPTVSSPSFSLTETDDAAVREKHVAISRSLAHHESQIQNMKRKLEEMMEIRKMKRLRL